MADDPFGELARQVRAVERERGLQLGRAPGEQGDIAARRGLLTSPLPGGEEIAEPSPEERTEEIRDAIRWHRERLRWHAERLSELGDDKIADAVIEAIGPKQPPGAPRTVSDDEAVQLLVDRVLWTMWELAPRVPVHEIYSRALRKHLPEDMNPDTFRRRVDRLCKETFGLTPAELLRLPEQK